MNHLGGEYEHLGETIKLTILTKGKITLMNKHLIENDHNEFLFAEMGEDG